MDRKLLTYAEHGNLSTKGRADDSSKPTKITSNNLSRGECPPKSTTRDSERNRSDPCPSATSAIPHNGPCTPRSHKSNKIVHFAHDCRSTGNTTVATLKSNGATPKGTLFLVWIIRHFQERLSKLKKMGKWECSRMVYAVGMLERGKCTREPYRMSSRIHIYSKIDQRSDITSLEYDEQTPEDGISNSVQFIDTSLIAEAYMWTRKIESLSKGLASPKTPTEIRQYQGLAEKEEDAFQFDKAEVVQCPNPRLYLKWTKTFVVNSSVTQEAWCGVNARREGDLPMLLDS
ncbi:hypothetical protein Tco_0369845 [Tanacetum coccineum]